MVSKNRVDKISKILQLLVCISVQRQRLIQSANGTSKPLQNGKHENIENGNIHVENQEENEHDNLSPFSIPGRPALQDKRE